MADSSCGGSTPLKALADRGSRDRSIQQDRHHLAAPGSSVGDVWDGPSDMMSVEADSPKQFRATGSGFNASANHAYTGFAAAPGLAPMHSTTSPGLVLPAQTGITPRVAFGPGTDAHGLQIPRASPSEHDTRSLPPTGAALTQSWATDFARFNAASGMGIPMAAGGQGTARVSPLPDQQGYHPPGMSQPLTGQHAFFGGSVGPAIPYTAPAIFASNIHPASTNVQGPQDATAAENEFDTAMAQWMAINGHGEDVNGILEELAQELEAGQRAGLPELQPTRLSTTTADQTAHAREVETHHSASRADTSRRNVFANHQGVEADSLPDIAGLELKGLEEEVVARNNTDDNGHASEVSEAARQLLETVQHEDGEKWQKSKFLHLMREFRDGTKSIVDDEIQDSSNRGT